MGKNKKIFYIDFIRAISIFIIVTYHFYAHFLDNNITGLKLIFDNGIWGMIGVAIFFMISGASLMYNYDEKLDIKQYAKKRFLGIYPMFWIGYIAVFIHIFYNSKSLIFGFPLYNLIFSLFAMDGYLSPYIQTFYLIGEWFLGCIVLIYVLFPILRKIMKKHSKILFIASTIIYLSVIIFVKNTKMPIHMNLIVSTYSFILGMYTIKYIKQYKIWHMIPALILAIVAYFIKTNNFNIIVLIANFIGYNLFVVFAYIGQKIENITIQRLFNIISKYSYAIFLVHHYVILQIEGTFRNRALRVSETVLLYITVWIVIAICAKILYMINKSVLSIFKKEENNNG